MSPGTVERAVERGRALHSLADHPGGRLFLEHLERRLAAIKDALLGARGDRILELQVEAKVIRDLQALIRSTEREFQEALRALAAQDATPKEAPPQ